MLQGCNDRKTLLRAEYERLLLEDANTLSAPGRLTDEEVRAYAECLGLSPEETDDFVQATRHRPYGFQALLDDIMQSLEQYMPNIVKVETGRIDADVCVAAFEFPLGAFNAVVRPVRNAGMLILVNSGLLYLLSHVTRLIGHTTSLSDRGFQFLDGVRVGVKRLTPPVALAEMIAIFLGHRVPGAGAVTDLQGPDLERMDRLFRSCVTFLLGHEYAHALTGHFDNEDVSGSLKAGMHVSEVEADWLAARLLLAPWRWGPFSDDANSTHLQTLLAGPLLFFSLESIVAEAERRAHKARPAHKAISGIAPPPVRRVMLLEYYRSVFGAARLPLTDLYASWIDRMSAEVLEHVDRIRVATPTIEPSEE